MGCTSRLPSANEHDVNVFVNAFEFKNPEKASTYRERGNKITSTVCPDCDGEGGYYDEGDSYDDEDEWKLGDEGKNKTRNFLEYTDVSDKLYQPVKRENKIRLVKGSHIISRRLLDEK